MPRWESRVRSDGSCVACAAWGALDEPNRAHGDPLPEQREARFAIRVLFHHVSDRLGQPPDRVFDIESALVVGPGEAEPHAWEVS